MLRRLIRNIKAMLSYLNTDAFKWLSSLKMFSDSYRLIAYRTLYLFKDDPFMGFILHARNGIKFKARRDDFGSIFGCWLSREYFPKEPFTLPDEATVVDIGASIGLFTLYIAAEYPGSRIFCHEPVTRSFEFLLDNICMNHLEKRVKAYNAAISSTRENRTLYVPKYDVLSSFFVKSGEGTIVKSLTLDDIVADAGEIDFLKIDTEGAEFEILLNIKRTTLRKIKTLSVEYHNGMTNHDRSEILEVFKKMDIKLKYYWSMGTG